MSFRSREYYQESDWDKTGIDVAFWNGYERSELIIRFLLIGMMSVDIISLISSLVEKFTMLKTSFLLLIIFLVLFIIPFNSNLTILHLEYKRIDIIRYKAVRYLKTIVTDEQSVYLKDFESATIHKVNFRLSPYWQLKLKFNDPSTTITIKFRKNLPYRLHQFVYYKLNRKCSSEIQTTLNAVMKFYPYFEFKKSFSHVEYRYLIFLSYFIGYFMFTMILPFII